MLINYPSLASIFVHLRHMFANIFFVGKFHGAEITAEWFDHFAKMHFHVSDEMRYLGSFVFACIAFMLSRSAVFFMPLNFLSAIKLIAFRTLMAMATPVQFQFTFST